MYVNLSILIAVSALLVLLLVVLSRLQRLQRELAETRRALDQETAVQAEKGFERLQAWFYLRDRLDLRAGIPFTKHWSASPDFLKLIADHALETRPSLVLECGSGASSLVLARCCQLNDSGRLVSLEDGPAYAAAAASGLRRYGLEAFGEVVHAPLAPVELGGERYDWYRPDALPEGPIDMLVIDGPSGFLGKQARYPALPLLYDRLADGCTLFLDDAAREDERAIVARWLAGFPGTVHDYVRLERGCSRLTLRRS